ncbi:1-aminocyclopropane-1-carboxylate deaminase [Candidatus Methylobacter favarea]|uniref:1-aminocyclopropane-1-carboxylate deaminase n=1 Tax=Candidatus Methylobacter favarea TaxID=2707345 RepID=A0A8S0XLE0_9GAMM|nr:pyridoxal-phosphate dependent enzyme [Candidatus Methylobacter favarea]CAA9892752.1 1-aminocyclopropane-1-carboxylate deaminase [Candidatus Methylobacter favarea]
MHPKLIKLETTFNKSVLAKINNAMLDYYGIELWMKRDDLLHPVISGNKWRKLKYSLDHALSLDVDTVISMGGAYSNHLHALAYAGNAIGLKTIGLIRGEQPETLTPTLMDMKNWGMKLKFVSRSEYRTLRQYQGSFDLPGLKPNQYWLPEGGAQALALKGLAELIAEIEVPHDVVCVSCGTGATLAGIIDAVPEDISVVGFAAFKNAGFLTDDITRLLSRNCNNWRINLDYHFGGFAKTTTELISFINEFELNTSIPLEPVYTGKMMYGLYDLLHRQYFKRGQRIIAVHTGGLQGKRK